MAGTRIMVTNRGVRACGDAPICYRTILCVDSTKLPGQTLDPGTLYIMFDALKIKPFTVVKHY